ncbi:MAG: zinc ribbon domain-containing protein [Candidatus Peregrinibacteria bacterium]|nr:zinc ribbon domain-containing protein [Candidatus Peregrinibacteria bacterium]
MPPILTDLLDFFSSDTFGLVKMLVLGYFGLLWLAVIVWVTRDALERSSSILFQAFSILLNITIPYLGVLLYLIIRPKRTALDSYYDELERSMLESGAGSAASCGKCLTPVDESYKFCPNCGETLKKSCSYCKKTFPIIWNICPHCGKDYKENKPTHKKTHKSPSNT